MSPSLSNQVLDLINPNQFSSTHLVRLLGFETGQEVRMPNWNWSSVEMRASSAGMAPTPLRTRARRA
jgi:hypothetical protein